uniref:Uncharacterized protein n=1 Tax=Ciona savignyi TaxID=51511 RepID=H2YKD9_CIOSA
MTSKILLDDVLAATRWIIKFRLLRHRYVDSPSDDDCLSFPLLMTSQSLPSRDEPEVHSPRNVVFRGDAQWTTMEGASNTLSLPCSRSSTHGSLADRVYSGFARFSSRDSLIGSIDAVLCGRSSEEVT